MQPCRSCPQWQRTMARFGELKQNPGEKKTTKTEPYFSKTLSAPRNLSVPLILLLHSDSPCTASTRPPVSKQIEKYWFLTPPAKAFLVGSQGTHVQNEFGKLTQVNPGWILAPAGKISLERQPGFQQRAACCAAFAFWESQDFLRLGRVRKETKELALSRDIWGWSGWTVGSFGIPSQSREKPTSLSCLDLAHFCSLTRTLPCPWSFSQVNYSQFLELALPALLLQVCSNSASSKCISFE